MVDLPCLVTPRNHVGRRIRYVILEYSPLIDVRAPTEAQELPPGIQLARLPFGQRAGDSDLLTVYSAHLASSPSSIRSR